MKASGQFLGLFAKLRNVTVNFTMCVFLSVCLSAHMAQLGSHWMDFHEISYLSTFQKPVEKIYV